MGMDRTEGLTKSIKCAAAITQAFTIAKPGSDDDTFAVAAAVGDLMVGVFLHTTSAANEIVAVQLGGIATVKIGGNVTRGNLITSDSSGLGVAAAPAAGVNNRVIGIALKSGVNGDEIPVLLSPGQIQGA